MARTLEQQIRKVINQHYGENLWMFRDDVGYREGTKHFVADVAKAIRGELGNSGDLPNPLAKYSKFSSTDRMLGELICKMRTRRGLTWEQLADAAEFNVEFVAALEKGYIIPSIDVWGAAYHALKPTKREDKELGALMLRDRTREEIVREVVETYYGLSLWAFKPTVGYEEAIEPFIKSLAALAYI